MVKAQLGPRAVILHTRTYRRGGLMGLGSKTVVEITAADEADIPRRRTENSAPAKPAPRRPEMEPTAGDLIRRTYAVAKAELSKQQAATPSPAVPIITTDSLPTPAPAPTPAPKFISAPETTFSSKSEIGNRKSEIPSDHFAQEMRSVHRLVARMSRRQHGETAPLDMPDKLFDHYLTLLRNEVAEELAEQVVTQVRQNLSPAQMEDVAIVRRAVLEAVARHIPTDELQGKPLPLSDGRPRTIALIGPTGVGKTTTIAKLAATFKLKQKLNVGLITLDTYRIAAVEQLRTYANIIGLPLHVVLTPEELALAVRRCASGPNRCDVVLIDTAGRSQRDDPRLEQLHTFIRAADPHEVHLVLSSTCSQSVLLDTVERFSSIRTERIIFTKLDEAVSFGVMLNVASKVNKRLSYVTTGQEVPHQIEPGRPERLAELVLGGGV